MMAIATALLTSIVMLACGTLPAGSTPETAQRSDFRERDEFNQTYQLPPGARVDVSSIRGPVEITSGDSATAEVKIVRAARTRADLEYHKVAVEQSGGGLVIRGIQEPEGRRHRNIQVNHYVVLKLPRRVDLSITSISGGINVANIDGETVVKSISGSAEFGNIGGRLEITSISGSVQVGNIGGDARVKSISGDLRLGQVNGALEVQSVSGGVNATLSSLSPEGIQIKSVSGSIEMAFKNEVNADFRAESFSGRVHLDMPNVARDSETREPNVRARIGSGGTPITIFSVSGNVRLRQS